MWQAIQEMVVAVMIFLGVWSIGVPAKETVEPQGGVTNATVATATVAFVTDGDTLEIVGGERVRLLGIDTPERNECHYEAARDYLQQAVDGKVVRLESDITNRDEYGRLLRHVFHVSGRDKRHLNYELVAEGHAVVLPIPPDRKYREAFKTAEARARAASLGRHGACR